MSIEMFLDVTNPGAFFACCGLFELAHRLWPGAEARFDGNQFQVKCGGSLRELLDRLVNAEINSSLSDRELKRLGSLMSAKKTSLSEADTEEKERLGEKWRQEYLSVTQPFDLLLNWWWDDDAGIKGLKTWAAKQFVLYIARPLLHGVRELLKGEQNLSLALQAAVDVNGLPFYFDASNNGQNTPRDTGFGLYTLRDIIETRGSTRPLLELGAFIGLQRFRPSQLEGERIYRYTLWRSFLPISVATAAVAGVFRQPDDRTYEFRTLARSEYMKAFLPAQLIRGNHS